MALTGMDADAVERIGGDVVQQAAEVQQVLAAVDALLEQADAAWDGADSERFREAWESSYRPSVEGVAAALEAFGTSTRAQAEAQHRASG